MRSTAALISICGILSVAADETCFMPIDVMFLQDTTGSFVDDLPLVVRQIPSMVAQILEQNPDSYFGVAEFKDKPYYPLGIESDFCYKLAGPLTPLLSEFQYDYSLLYASGGGDLPEAQFQALIDLAEDPAVGWRDLERPARRASHNAGAHLVIMSTDAPPHLNGDIAKYHPIYPKTIPESLPANLGHVANAGHSASCRDYDYPSADQMAAVLKEHAIYLAILTPNMANITGAWRWVNEELLKQPAGFYQFIESDSSDLIDGVLKVIKEVTKTACAQTLPPDYSTSGTTATPATTATTTTTTPTTTTSTTTPTTTTMTTTPTTTTTTTTPTTTTTTTPTTTPTTTTTTLPTTTTTTPTATTPTTTTTTTTTITTTTTTTITTTTPTTTTTTPMPTPTTPTTTTTIPTTTTTTPTTTTTIPTTTTTSPTTTATLTTVGSTTTTTPVTTPSLTTSSATTTSEPDDIVTAVGSTQTKQDSTSSECHDPCPSAASCCNQPVVRVEMKQRPKRLVIEYDQ